MKGSLSCLCSLPRLSGLWKSQSRFQAQSPQVKVGLDLLNGSVKDLHIDPKEVAVIAPYAANVKLIIDETQLSFRGQEGSITLNIMDTDHPRPGLGFTQNKQRLNVLLTRQKCALFIVDNINFGEPFRNSTEKPLFKVENSAGEIFVKASALRFPVG
ncbi:uncharacterized protein FIESC28_09553 [Fusarium coffeatum]|uniref:DNA2/NAM7 helicase-like C-terminal domain-containing protein n=1 Tax=Fusarium coffeatum TaxID=231269 RepID=A0A366QZ44_9HYPO|nr:uncharacterized protein FIESC28_09553 [Fusarium coffeatum]RBR10167.1 hypothetical protein FIESC28_09553 [Fusarium coffeatum]